MPWLWLCAMRRKSNVGRVSLNSPSPYPYYAFRFAQSPTRGEGISSFIPPPLMGGGKGEGEFMPTIVDDF